MSSWAAQIRRQEAARRREEREARKRHKDLERRIKERARLTELELARLEVEMHENMLEELLSVHKEQSTRIDWARYACALPPHEPLRSGRREFAASLNRGVVSPENASGTGSAAAEEALLTDEREHQAERENFTKTCTEWMRMRSLAKRVLAGQAHAYSEAISEFSSFSEMAVLGSSIHVTVHSPKLIGCVLMVNGREVIPKESKSLTAAGKLSVKAMPKLRFHEIYQDYVCGCVLRLAREMFALLPITGLLVTASVDGVDNRTGKKAHLPVLSVVFERAAIDQLDFERLDPSDSMENFAHHGDAKTSRKSGEFVPIVPFTPADLMPTQPERMDFSGLLTNVRQLRAEIGSKITSIASDTEDVTPDPPLTV